MSIEVRCTCGRRFNVPDEFAGKKGKCSECGRFVNIPEITNEDLERIVAGSGIHSSVTDDDLVDSPAPPKKKKIQRTGVRGPVKRGARGKTGVRRKGAAPRRGAPARRSRYDEDEEDGRYSRFQREPDNPNVLLGIISFLIPLAGIILGIVYITKHTRADKKTGKICFLAVVANVVLQVIIIIAVVGAAASAGNRMMNEFQDQLGPYNTVTVPTGICTRCNGKGVIQCPVCGGKGRIERENDLPIQCYQCGGDGEIECPDCGGTGRK